MKRRVVGLMLAVLWGAPCVPAAAATVTGNVTLVDSDARSSGKRTDSDIVVWLEPVGGGPRTNSPAPKQDVPKQVTMDQRKKTFIPHVLAIEVGTAVDFPNNDPIDHNAFSNFEGQIFDVHLYSPQTSRRVVFRRTGMVRVFCNIHETMSAVIAVLPTPYFAVTGADGRFEIAAPAGEYKLRFWHEQATPEELAKMERTVTIGEETFTVPRAAIQVRRGATIAHKDKYGHDYPEKAPEYIFYPGVRR